MSLTASLKKSTSALNGFHGATGKVATALSKLKNAAGQADTGVGRLRNGVSRARSGIDQVKNASGKTVTGLNKLKTTAGQTDTAIGKLKNSGSRAQSGLSQVKNASGQAVTNLNKLKTTAGQTDGALAKAKGADKLRSTLDRLKTGTNNSQKALQTLKRQSDDAGSAFVKSKGNADKLKTSLDKLRKSADNSQKALRDVKRQADGVESSVGKAGKKADGTGASMKGLDKGLKGASLAQKGLNTAMRANPMGLLLGLLAPLITQFVDMDKVVAGAKKGFEIAWRAIKTATSSALDFLKPLLKGVVNLYTAPIRGLITALNGAIRGLNHIHVSIPSWVPGFGGKSFGINLPEIPQIPTLAEGGVVRARSGGTLALLAEAGESEAVIPLSRLERMIGGAPGGSAALHRLTQAVERLAERPVHVQVDSQTIARAVLVGQRQLARR
ncbi:hypothetical protein ACSNOK_15580 [Streptomyces sp. URMC 126]|uniref:hypothetical protein n=1 Tax=Streptomyces sp. URMC 126 TaxID=3423401 RepID=UPI003F19BE76